MEFTFTDEQKALRQMAREFALKEFPAFSKRCDDKEEYPHELMKKAAAQGLLGIMIPQQYGGAGLGMIESAICAEELNAIDPGLALCIFAADFGTEAIIRLGSEEQKQKWLAPIPLGQKMSGAAISEAGAGSDVAGATCAAVKQGDHYVVNGAKMWITNGDVADYFITLVMTDPKNPKPHARFSLLVIEKDTPGFKANKIHGKLGIRASDTAELQFTDCKVPAANLLGEPGKGFYYVMEFFNNTRIGVAAQGVGIAQGALNIATQYAMQREAFGKPIADLQGIQFKLAEMATRAEAARLLTYKAAYLNDQGKPSPQASSMAKWFAGRAAVENADEAVQILGGMGYVDEMPAEKFYRDAKITEIYEGTKEVHKLIIARSLFGRIKG
ncbi:MAG: butyryl-CoA dehydrogenase [Thermoplasmata archaeon]|jgi:alkylation response protein AidB-like acyl-CoA dehydrogenase|nr:butyryl-CoA dehydrogenase [Thermoplasmata archaeon]